jgi:hypothetical protein
MTFRSRGPATAITVAAILTLSACAPHPTPAPASAHPAPATTTGATSGAADADAAGPADWISQFCAQAPESYLTELNGAFDFTEAQTTVADLVPTEQSLYSLISGLDATLAVAAHQLQALTPTPADAAGRTVLLGVYQRLDQALGTAEQQIQALPTNDVARFTTAATATSGAALTAIQTAKTTIAADHTLGPAYAANPGCR